MNTKICTKCGEEKAATTEFFRKEKKGKYGLKGQCKSCYKIYVQQNKEKIAERNKKYHKDNKEKIAERKKQWHKKNKYLTRQSRAKRRAAERNQTPHYANLDLIKLIYENCPKGYQVDHMVPISKEGLHHESNLCYLPAGINSAKGAKTIEEFGVDFFNEKVTYWQDVL